ncbi:AsnC family transcriptional regulator [Saccharopolyspora erythraea NRRL 2338]|nr:AsnC family transcriptional regulator [Saccharopolyspora erythraea D]PFG96926.1 AsnC family transcriptional regulator [Saccharopolyspora erythraea NRRL 2338]
MVCQMSSEQADRGVRAGRSAELDDLDRRIVEELRRDGRVSMRALAERLHISRANVYTRVERLHRDGVITGYSAVINPERYGYGVSAYVYLKVSQHSWKSVRRRVLEIPEVAHGALVSGENDLVLLVRTRDAQCLRELVLNRLQTIPDVVSSHTVLILDELPSHPA